MKQVLCVVFLLFWGLVSVAFYFGSYVPDKSCQKKGGTYVAGACLKKESILQ